MARQRKSKTRAGAVVLVLGDQLTLTLSSLSAADPASDVVLMAEVAEEATYVRHHKKKIAFLFSAMRHFADELRAAGWRVVYRTIDENGPEGSLREVLRDVVAEYAPSRVLLTEPGEWRLASEVREWSAALGLPVEVLGDRRFVCSQAEFGAWARDRRQLRMEYFYREMRRKTGLLMDGRQPEGGVWNFDKENRKPASSDLFMPTPKRFAPDAITREVLSVVARRFPDHFGTLEPFWFAATRTEAEAARDHFIATALPYFGDFQDAMIEGQRFLYHSVLSIYINCGLLDPLDLCRRVEAAYRDGRVPLNSAEGYIRQIIGWREYVRGIYWLKMPEYAASNALGHARPLPRFYWSAETKMSCVADAIAQTRDEAYAHHIQRLMVTGNFALLAGIDPHALHEWYLEVYADAYEWVEMPNTIGMSQFADGGLLASKPYVASGAYIDRMSNYCGKCHYDVRSRTEERSCPFNALYWRFIDDKREKLAGNPRMAQMVRVLERMSEPERAAIARRSDQLLSTLDEL
jgi:deoxyribodipyrimidine photolyase-related protein